MVDLNSAMSVIILSINDLNTPIKRQRLSDKIIKRTSPNYILLTRNSAEI